MASGAYAHALYPHAHPDSRNPHSGHSYAGAARGISRGIRGAPGNLSRRMRHEFE